VGLLLALPGLASRWDPPENIPHLNGTPAKQRAEIDRLVKVLLDVDAGRDSLVAKERLVALGKPAFPRVLAAMARITNGLTDVDNMQERLLESSLKLGDSALREIDPYLKDKGKTVIRPGTDLKYARYILRLHYKRWKTVLAPGEARARSTVHVVSVRGRGEARITLERAHTPVTLVLVSRTPTRWRVTNPGGVHVLRVATNGVVEGVPRDTERLAWQRPVWFEGEGPLGPFADAVRRITGRAPSSIQSRAETSDFAIHMPKWTPREVEVHAVGLAGAPDGEVTVHVEKTERAAVLVLMCNGAATWKLERADGAVIDRVIVAGPKDQQVRGLPEDALLIERGFWAAAVGTERYKRVEAAVFDMTGKRFSSFHAAGTATRVRVR
jgi:hypothetical protein